MSQTQCTTCRGEKRVVGAGFMLRDCYDCLGTGYKKAETDTEQLRNDLRGLAEAYEKLEAENAELKAEIKQLKSSAKIPAKKSK
jgi:hypothetical protein